jgi:hypothetical protein
MRNGNAGSAIYALGIFGAWVWFWQQANTFWEYAFAIFQGLFWPAWMVFGLFGFHGGVRVSRRSQLGRPA